LELDCALCVSIERRVTSGGTLMRSVILWAVGLPIPLIIILWLITGHA
jgi:hypothetical protein